MAEWANALTEGFLNQLSPEGRPVHQRLMLEGMRGKQDMISRKDFDEEDQNFMRLLIEHSIKRQQGKDKRKGVQWDDYYAVADQLAKEGKMVWNKYGGSYFGKGDAYGRVHDSLGRFNFQQFDDGSVLINDKYDFNTLRDLGYKIGPTNEANPLGEIGRKHMGAGTGRARDVHIGLPYK